MIIQVVNTVKTRLKFQLIRLLLATSLQRIKENGHEVWRLDYLVNQPSARTLSSKKEQKRENALYQETNCSLFNPKSKTSLFTLMLLWSWEIIFVSEQFTYTIKVIS